MVPSLRTSAAASPGRSYSPRIRSKVCCRSSRPSETDLVPVPTELLQENPQRSRSAVGKRFWRSGGGISGRAPGPSHDRAADNDRNQAHDDPRQRSGNPAEGVSDTEGHVRDTDDDQDPAEAGGGSAEAIGHVTLQEWGSVGFIRCQTRCPALPHANPYRTGP